MQRHGIRNRPYFGLLLTLGIAACQGRAAEDGGGFAPTRFVPYKRAGGAELLLHVFEPQGHRPEDRRAAIVFFFGGGWVGGRPDQFYPQCDYLASRGMVAISAEYRVRDTHGVTPFECVRDGKSAIRWVRAHATQLGIDPARIVAAGGSAGGHVAACTGVVPGFDEPDEDQTVSSVPAALVLFNPALVLAPVGEDPPEAKLRQLAERFAGRDPRLVSPYHHVRAGAPPTLILHGEEDTTVPIATARLFADAMRSAGNRCDLIAYPGERHGFFNYGRGERFYETLQEADRFLSSLGLLEGEPTIDRWRAAQEDRPAFRFQHHFVDDALPGSEWGQTALLDIDSDGDLDFVTGRSRGEIRWYEFLGSAAWKMHVLGTDSPSEVGGAALDVDGDGHLDFVTGGAWYRRPVGAPVAGAGAEAAAGELWERIVFDPDLKGVHDVVAADLDGDGRPEVITQADQSDVRFYTIPKEAPRGPWRSQRVCASVHAGLAAGDLDGDGDTDIVRSQIWLENADGAGKEWMERAFCGIPWADRKEVGFYYLASRCQVADINGDGRNDIVLTEAEFSGARVAWFEAPADPRTVPWEAHILPQSGPEPRGPYHSLQVADFDLDGDPDIFSGEMERFGVAPHRWFIWENRGGEFVERVILDQGLGTHEAVAGDVDGDGDIDLVGKLWSPVADNANAGRNHVDYLENLLGDLNRRSGR